MKIQSVSDLNLDRLKILVYGHAGAGKTYLASTIEEPTLVLSVESGLLSIKESKLDAIDITTDDSGTLVSPAQRVRRLQEAYKFLTTEECRSKYKWVFIDSLSEISQNMMEALYLEFPDRKDALPMYGENAKRMRSLIKAFRDLPWYNVVFTALAEDDKDENNKRYKSIQMVGKIAQALPGLLDEVFFLTAHEGEEGQIVRRLITKGTDKVICKDRSGKLEMYEQPNLQTIADKIRRN